MNRFRLIAALLLTSTTYAAWAAPLSTAAQDNSPKFVQKGGQMTGIGVDVLRGLEKIDPELKFTGDDQFWPQKRIEAGLSSEVPSGSGHLDVFVGLARTEKREAMFRYSSRVIYTSKNVLFARADEKVSVNTLEDIRQVPGNNMVLANNSYVQAATLRKVEGLKVDDGAKTNSDNLRKLIDGKGRFFFASELSGLYEAKQEGLTAKIRVIPVEGQDSPLYVVYSAVLPKPTVERLEAAIGKLIDSGEMKRILAKYQ